MKRSTNINQFLALLIALFVATAVSACSDISGTDYSNDISNESFSQEFDKRDSRNNGNGADQPSGVYPKEISGIGINALDENGKIYVCKYTRTPGGIEILKKGNKGLVHVDPNSVRKDFEREEENEWPYVVIGNSWQDKHYMSRIINPEIGFEALNGYKQFDEDDLSDACEGIITTTETNSIGVTRFSRE